MFSSRSALVAVGSLLFASPLLAQDTGNFVIRLGTDTTAVEHYTRTPQRLEIDQVARSPRVLLRHYVFEYGASGAVQRVAITITNPSAPAGAPPMQQVNATFAADSVAVETRRDTSIQRSSLKVPAGTVAISGATPWSVYEGRIMRLVSQKADSLPSPLLYVGASSMNALSIRKLGKDSVVVQTQTEVYHVKIDRSGHVQNVVPLRGTQKFSVDRVATLDLKAAASAFLAREQQGGAMGAYSPRDSVKAVAAGATLWIDYGRPSKRGRAVFGGIVPWGEVWRTGANAATQFRTDKPLQMGNQLVPAGFYTLWTIPSPTGWKLVINGETGQWGTEHKADRDLYTIDMTVNTLPQAVERFTIGIEPNPQGGVLNLDWDTTRASLPFTVKP